MDEKRDNPSPAAPAIVPALVAAQEEAAAWQARAGRLQAQAHRAESERDALHKQVTTLETQLRALEAYTAELQVRLARSESLLDAARNTPRQPAHLAAAVARPLIKDIVDELPRSTDRDNQYGRRPLAQIRRLVLHHTGADTAVTPQELAELAVNDPRHQWPGIGFHFVIDPQGTIYQTNRLETISYHVPDHNQDTVGIVLVGAFDAAAPADPQLAAAAALLAWLLQELGLSLDSVLGHGEITALQGDCPGAAWLNGPAWKHALLAQVQRAGARAGRPLYHYLLFWQTADAWAEKEWQAAGRYIARFRPTVGFSSQEAALAENVTIVGGTSGVPPQVEDELRAAGCRVQRIAGKSLRETRALLDGLAERGQRFLADAAAPDRSDR